MRIAALDLGSNSFHMIVVEARPDGSIVPILRRRQMLRLADRVARVGAFGPDAIAEAVAVVGRFAAIAVVNGADEIVAVATAAVREAADGAAFVERVRNETGIAVEVIDGTVEAELIFLAVRSSVPLDMAPVLAADVGGGSLELMVGDRSQLRYAASLRLGVGRLSARISEDPPSGADLGRLQRHIDEELSRPMAEIAPLSPRRLIGSSGTFVALARMADLASGGTGELADQLTVAKLALDEVRAAILSRSSKRRAKLAGAEARRAELLPAGAVLLERLMATSGLDELTVSPWALREGIVLRAIGADDRAEPAGDRRAHRP